MLERILLAQEQKDLLLIFVEASRNVPHDKREKFLCIGGIAGMGNQSSINHSGLPNGEYVAYDGDIEILERNGLVSTKSLQGGAKYLDIMPLGFQYYEKVKAKSADAIEHIEDTINSYLHSDRFQRKYATAYQKWSEAEKLLWGTDSLQQLTMIGHLCREAIQVFVSLLVEIYQPEDVPDDIAKTVNRLDAVLKKKFQNESQREQDFLKALMGYCRTLNGIIQRQEHGDQKKGQSLIWEDGRRVVFHTAIVMFEIEKSLSSKQN